VSERLSFSSFRNDNNNNANKKGKETGARYCTQIHPQFSCEEGIEGKKKKKKKQQRSQVSSESQQEN
jgi:hypothetical protein